MVLAFRFILHSFAAIFVWIALCLAGEDSNNFFNSPGRIGPTNTFTNDPSWPIGTIQTVDFTTSASSYAIRLFQQVQDGTSHGRADFIQNITFGTTVGHVTFNWQVQLYNADLSASPVFFFWGSPQDANSASWTSHYFNITNEPVSSANLSPSLSPSSSSLKPSDQSSSSSSTPDPGTSSSSSPSPSPTTSSSGASSSTSTSDSSSSTATSDRTSGLTTASTISSGSAVIQTVIIMPTLIQASSTPSSSSSAVPASTDSTTMKIGLGVGIGATILIAALAGIFYFLRRRAARKSTPTPGVAPAELDYVATPSKLRGGAWEGVYEAPTKQEIIELQHKNSVDREMTAELPSYMHSQGVAELPTQHHWPAVSDGSMSSRSSRM